MGVCPRACNFCVSLPMVIVNWIKLSEAFDDITLRTTDYHD